jgi:hypothetical protein
MAGGFAGLCAALLGAELGLATPFSKPVLMTVDSLKTIIAANWTNTHGKLG